MFSTGMRIDLAMLLFYMRLCDVSEQFRKKVVHTMFDPYDALYK